MPTRAEVLKQLDDQELEDLLHALDKQSPKQHEERVTALQDASVTDEKLADAAKELGRRRLKALCTSLGLKADGRELDVLTKRIFGLSDAAAKGVDPAPTAPGGANAVVPANKSTIDKFTERVGEHPIIATIGFSLTFSAGAAAVVVWLMSQQIELQRSQADACTKTSSRNLAEIATKLRVVSGACLDETDSEPLVFIAKLESKCEISKKKAGRQTIPRTSTVAAQSPGSPPATDALKALACASTRLTTEDPCGRLLVQLGLAGKVAPAAPDPYHYDPTGRNHFCAHRLLAGTTVKELNESVVQAHLSGLTPNEGEFALDAANFCGSGATLELLATEVRVAPGLQAAAE